MKQRFSLCRRPLISRVDSIGATEARFAQGTLEPINSSQSRLPAAMQRRVSIRPCPSSSVARRDTSRFGQPGASRVEKKSRGAPCHRWRSRAHSLPDTERAHPRIQGFPAPAARWIQTGGGLHRDRVSRSPAVSSPVTTPRAHGPSPRYRSSPGHRTSPRKATLSQCPADRSPFATNGKSKLGCVHTSESHRQ